MSLRSHGKRQQGLDSVGNRMDRNHPTRVRCAQCFIHEGNKVQEGRPHRKQLSNHGVDAT